MGDDGVPWPTASQDVSSFDGEAETVTANGLLASQLSPAEPQNTHLGSSPPRFQSPSSSTTHYEPNPSSHEYDTNSIEHADDSTQFVITEEDPTERFGLRTNNRDRVYFGGTYLDKDTSGDYDPSNLDIQIAPPEKKKRPLPVVERDPAEDGSIKRAKTAPSLLSARQRGVSFVISLKIKSAAGLDLLRKHLDHWPEDLGRVGAVTSTADEQEAEAADQATSNEAYLLRCNQHRLAQQNDCITDLTGHPVGRGCKACFAIGQRCSLLDPAGIYPCEACIEDSCDCELVVAPVRKRPCEACKIKSIRCPYADSETDHSAACSQCQEGGRSCVAGPAYDPKRTRLTNEGKPGTCKPPLSDVKQFISCTPCKIAKKACPLRLKQKQLDPPCPHCLESSIECTFEPVGKSQKSLQNHKEENLEELFTPKKQPERKFELTDDYFPAGWTPGQKLVAQSQARPTGRILTIQTKLPHPISFASAVSSGKPCHWCTSPAIYSLKGMGTRSVKVEERLDQKGYTEICGGHTEAGKEPSRMCWNCTMQRVYIVVCPNHFFRQIPGNAELDWHNCYGAVRNVSSSSGRKDNTSGHVASTDQDHGAKVRESLRRFCSLCPSLADYACITAPAQKDPRVDVGPRGCGLRLCRSCHSLVNPVDRDLQKVMEQVSNIRNRNPNLAKEYWPRGIRPDFDFLRENSFLMKQVLG